MEKYDLWNENFKIYKEIDMEYHKLATRYGLSDSEFFILNSLYSSNTSISQQDIVNEWTYSKQTINSAIKILTKKALIKTEIDSNNKRRKIIKPTMKGTKLINNIMPKFSEIEESTFGQIPSNLIEKYNQSLSIALDQFKEKTLLI